MEQLPKPERPRCANCGAKLRGKFCHKCGEKQIRHKDLALSAFFRTVFEKITHLDSRFLRSLLLLIIRPGFLSLEYMRGRRKRYARPISLFFVINLLYFITIGYSSMRTFENPLRSQLRNPYHPVVERLLDARFAGQPEEARADFEVRFDRRNHTLAKSMLLLLTPLMALAFWLLYPLLYYGEHLITALHFQALLLVQNMVLGIVIRGSLTGFLFGAVPNQQFINEVGEPLAWIFLLIYFTFRTVYQQAPFATAWRALVFSLLWLPLLIGYRFLVFLGTFYTA